MSLEPANGSSRFNFPAPGRGRESPEFGADRPIIPRSTNAENCINALIEPEMLAFLAKKKDR
jgi:hypothetical protein